MLQWTIKIYHITDRNASSILCLFLIIYKDELYNQVKVRDIIKVV